MPREQARNVVTVSMVVLVVVVFLGNIGVAGIKGWIMERAGAK